MTIIHPNELGITSLPDHTQLPESDGTFVKNFQEHPQSILLTDSIRSTLDQLHPDGRYAIGQDCGIYWRLTEPPERGAEAPDWFYVPNVKPLVNGEVRRSYVLWQEYVAPLIVLEFVSGNGSEERDKTPPASLVNGDGKAGKFWVYEQAIRVPFYGIYEVKKASIEMYHLVENHYEQLEPNERNHYPIPQMGVELGIWQGRYANMELPWLRWWDSEGNLLLTGEERASVERQRAETERQRAENERQRADRLAEKLREMGINPDEL
ncbi:Uma2 family endonuclease [Limnoraphis robusta]|uniref:Uma2 family endonuclease n=1 Tax=Limnoraphis robusta CCNP1315 TaxID=3110306 RepID=A0ABU5U6H5_9CYAN|nr:Uma2 family endonuclease [Limnoraphis robusta]MEA5522764.1 Uma2 family endonuclease [Limnoraphis robusta CCNP1315]MEA5543774.1 Uma2 family endonuclease [Limnoraphis robusta CCNP1324]